jgi:limonene-1,2-epoxide hydrolase
MASPEELAVSFSSHRFSDTYDHLTPSVRWVSVGSSTMVGRDAVVEACEQATAEMAELRLDRRRFLAIAGDAGVAIDTVTAYVDPSGEESVVASCDIYEFQDGRISAITSYAVEV